MKIATYYCPKPIPDRSFDWSAIDADTYDGTPGQPIGYGATETEAIDDFIRLCLEEMDNTEESQ